MGATVQRWVRVRVQERAKVRSIEGGRICRESGALLKSYSSEWTRGRNWAACVWSAEEASVDLITVSTSLPPLSPILSH